MNPVSLVLLSIAVALTLVVAVAVVAIRARHMQMWLPSYLKGGWKAAAVPGRTRHLMFCFVDHFEPRWEAPDYRTECRRVDRWRTEYPRLAEGLHDADGRAPIHTYFYPGEEYRPEHLDKLVELCRLGLGEIEIHLHHADDTEAGLREKLRDFTQVLVERHDALPVDAASGQPRWAFIHGNWSLDNAHPAGENCGVNNELIVLREEGCYADFTLPAAPDPSQTRTINSIYYATDDPLAPKSHDTGLRVRVGSAPTGDLMIVQGPLGLNWRRPKFGFMPRIESGDVRTSTPPTPERIDRWVDAGIHVAGRPEWIFVKVHTHGTQERDTDTLLGAPMREAFEYLCTRYNDGHDWKLHFVSAREMYNIIKAAEAGLDDDPGRYRDYAIPRAGFTARARAPVADIAPDGLAASGAAASDLAAGTAGHARLRPDARTGSDAR